MDLASSTSKQSEASQTLDKFAIAQALHEIAMLLKLKGENQFRVRAYELGARAMEELREEPGTLLDEQRLTEVPGIGAALAATIGELLTTGRCAQLERLRQELPEGALELAEIPGLSLKKMLLLWKELGIRNLAELKHAASEGHLVRIKGFGAKTQEKILEGIARWEQRDVRVALSDALAAAEPLADYLQRHPKVEKLELAGSLRRWRETVSDADFLILSSEPDAVLEHLLAYPKVVRTLRREERAATVMLSDGLQVEVHIAAAPDFAAALLRLTGSSAHVRQLESVAREKGVSLDAPAEDERALYHRLALPYIEPELREARGELEAAQAGSLPTDLVALSDIVGMTHCHTLYSDGKNSVEEMARAAEAMGMQYLTITDHSPTAYYASGVTLDRLKEQWDEIARVQELVKVKLLRGTESDILADGSLDYPPAILEQFDVIIASIHSRMKMDEDAMTRRIVNAMRQPIFKIWGHALGRLILRREPFACRVEEILEVIAESKAAIEINGDPHRLDLPPEWVQRARTRGIRFVISTDAHSIRGLQNLRFGVHAARRGWLRRDEVLNTLDASAFARAVRPVQG